MPIYEYRCSSCGHTLEAIQKVSDSRLVECPVCAKATLQKQLTAGAFRLSGGGWYETDFKTGDKKRNLAGDGGGSAGDKKSDSDAGGSSGGDKKSGSDAGGSSTAATASPAKSKAANDS